MSAVLVATEAPATESMPVAEALAAELAPVVYLQAPEVVSYANPPAEDYLAVPVASTGVQVEGDSVALPEAAAPVSYLDPPTAAPSVVNVSPEIFARLMAGGSLTPEEMALFTGGSIELASPEVPEVPDTVTEAAPASAASAEGKKRSSKKKRSSLKASKKSSKACC